MATRPVKHRTQFAKRVRRLRKSAKLSLEKAAERGDITANFWGDVERGKKVPSLDTIVAMARGLGVSPRILLTLEREDDERDLRKRIETLLVNCTPQQLELIHRLVAVLVEG
ncbi:MAG: helix-turn-helix transcriptional regulator [Candidatus Acidiferrales bacterium]